MHVLSNKTIREIALDFPLTTRVFQEFKIDYCCRGRLPFVEACSRANADPLQVLHKLESIIERTGRAGPTLEVKRTPAELAAYIAETHHTFTRSEIDRLLPLARKVASRHGKDHPELAEIEKLFSELASELLVHMRNEEMVLFPYIERLERAARADSAVPPSCFGSVEHPIKAMMYEHEKAGELLRRLRWLSGDYSAPPDACPSYKGLYAGLEDLERDLHQHIHLENNVLFPETERLYSELKRDPAGMAA
jgi:regulator of cell morphogenesis and NO signaling